MKKVLFVILAMCFLVGCVEKKSFQQQLGMEEVDVNAFADFYCVVDYNGSEESLVIGGETAKELYRMVSEYTVSAFQNDEGIVAGDNYVHISFERGDSSNLDAAPQGGYYGSFLIYEEDEMWVSASPAHSFGISYQLKKGAYKEVVEFLK